MNPALVTQRAAKTTAAEPLLAPAPVEGRNHAASVKCFYPAQSELFNAITSKPEIRL
jgi:hypothetical protein